MSNKIDERIVELKFNSKQFEQGVKDTTDSLEKLNNSLQLDGVANGIENISSKFNTLGAIGFTAIQTLTNSAIGFGQKIAGAVLDPLIQGGKKRAMNIEQAKFQFKGLGMDVEQSMADALYAVKGTAFGLDEAAVAASQFGASGIQSGAEMQNALRGISGVAAMAGSSYTDMANVFTKVAGQGRLMGDDLNRLGNRGINAASTLADYFNKTGLAANATEADIRAMVTRGEIDFNTFATAMSDAFGEHATKANETYTGSLSNLRAALSRIGAMYFTPHLERSRTIFNALTPAIDAVAEAVTPLIDVFNELANQGAAKLVKFIEGVSFSDLTVGINIFAKALKQLSDFVGKVFAPIKKAFDSVFGGVQLRSLSSIAAAFVRFTSSLDVSSKAGERIQTVFTGIFKVVKFIVDILIAVGKIIWSVFSSAAEIIGSFLGIFSPLIDVFTKFNKTSKESGTDIVSLADKFSSFMNNIVKPIIGFFNQLRDSIQGVVDTKLGKWASDLGTDFEPLTWLGEKIIAIWTTIKDVFSSVWAAVKPIFTNIGNALSQLGEGFRQFGAGMDFGVIFGAANTGILFYFANAIKNLFSDGIEEIQKVTGIFSGIKDIFDQVTGVLEAMQTKLKAEALMKIAIAIGILAASMFLLGSINPDNIGSAVVGMATLVGVLAGVMLTMEKLVSMKGFSGAKLMMVTVALNLMAAAILVLAIALKILSTIGWDQIWQGLIALAGGLGIMVGAVLLLGNAGPKAILGAAALAIMSSALLVLSLSLKILASMSWDEIGRGLVALAGGLAIMVGAVLLLGLAGPTAILAALALSILAVALTALIGAIAILGNMSMESLAQGLIALTAALLVIIGAVLLLGLAGPLAILGAASMLVMAAALIIITAAIAALAALPGDGIAQAIGAIAAALGVLIGLGTAMGILSPLLILAGIALIGLASGLLILALAIGIFAAIPAEAVGTAIGTIAAALGVLIGFGILLGVLSPILLLAGIALGIVAVSMVLIAASMAIFAISLGLFATNAPAAAEGLVALGAAMLQIALAIPIMAVLGVALLAFGAGALVAGAGIAVLAVGLALMAGALQLLAMTAPMGAMALTMLVGAMVSVVAEAPGLIALGAAFILVGAGLLVLGVGGMLAGAALMILSMGLMMIAMAGPKGSKALEKVVETIAGMIWQLPQLGLMAAGFAALGAALLVLGAGSMLAGAGGMLLAVSLMMLTPAATMGAKAMELVAKATEKLMPVIPGLLAIAAAAIALGAGFTVAGVGGAAAAAGISAVVLATMLGTASVIAFTASVTSLIPLAMSVMTMMGVASQAVSSVVVNSFKQIQNGILSSIPASTMAVAILVTAITMGLIARMNASSGMLYSSGYSVGRNVARGMADGVGSGASLVVNAAIELAQRALSALNKELDIRSPSRKTHKSGTQTGAGFAGGIKDSTSMVVSASRNLADSAITTMSDAMSGISDFIMNDLDSEPTIRPVLDLSGVKKDASLLGSVFSAQAITLAGSRSQAEAISNSRSKASPNSATQEANAETVVNNYSFVQNNTSPEALSDIDIYRQTNNQIALAKEVLKK